VLQNQTILACCTHDSIAPFPTLLCRPNLVYIAAARWRCKGNAGQLPPPLDRAIANPAVSMENRSNLSFRSTPLDGATGELQGRRSKSIFLAYENFGREKK